jgi:hypothetical protein
MFGGASCASNLALAWIGASSTTPTSRGGFRRGIPRQLSEQDRRPIQRGSRAVRAAPPPSFSGGGYWEAMHGEMGGYYEIRLTGPGRRQHRLFCLLDSGSDAELAERGFDEPKIAVLTGLVKPPGTKFSNADYRRVREVGNAYRGTLPRPVAR